MAILQSKNMQMLLPQQCVLQKCDRFPTNRIKEGKGTLLIQMVLTFVLFHSYLLHAARNTSRNHCWGCIRTCCHCIHCHYDILKWESQKGSYKRNNTLAFEHRILWDLSHLFCLNSLLSWVRKRDTK